MQIIYEKKEDFVAAIKEYQEFYGEQTTKPEVYVDTDSSSQYTGFTFLPLKDKRPVIYRWRKSSHEEQQKAISEFESMGYKVIYAIVTE